MKVELEISNAYLADVLDGAVIHYWAHAVRFPYFQINRDTPTGWHALLQGKIRHVIVIELETEVATRITAADLARGMQVVARKCPAMLGELCGNDMQQDAESGDVLLQCAIFGELKYG